MSLQFWSISSSSALHNSWALTHSENLHSLTFRGPISLRKPKPSSPTCLRAQLLDEIAPLAHNKVVIAAGISAAIGQLTKPLTSVIFYGKDLDFKAVVQPGGFPSSHSSAVVATATTLGLERGLSDSIFGLTVIYAGIVMYDAQGVRREAGNHAKVLNKLLLESTRVNYVSTNDRVRLNSQPQTSSSSLKLDSLESLLSEEPKSFPSNDVTKQTTQTQISTGLVTNNGEEGLERAGYNSTSLKESIGHTEVEVTAGALLGFLVGLAVYAIM